ncbi:hypothetical protein ACFVH6_13990 [Spirillospora sp. NPDC127200]
MEHTAHHHSAHTAHTDAHAGHAGAAYTLDFPVTELAPGETTLSFRVLDPHGAPATAYTPIHDRELHLIVVRADLTAFWHVHPERQEDGTWTVRLNLPEAGPYRAFADTAPQGAGGTLTLHTDLTVTGRAERRPLPEAARTFAVDGYEVALTGDPAAGAGGHLVLTVRKDGVPVTDLEPYLGAYGHLVVLRAEDLAYVHVHPSGEPGDGVTEPGPGIAFHVAVPGPGEYRLFLDFKHEGTVRTAAFTATAR